MSQPDPPASDLGAQEAPWLARLRRLANMPMLADASRISVGLTDLQATIDHIDAQAARLAAVERVLHTHKWHMTCCEDLLEGLEGAIGSGAVGAGEARDGE